MGRPRFCVTQELAYGGKREFKLSQPPIYFILAPQELTGSNLQAWLPLAKDSLRSYLLVLPGWSPGQVKPRSAELCQNGPQNWDATGFEDTGL